MAASREDEATGDGHSLTLDHLVRHRPLVDERAEAGSDQEVAVSVQREAFGAVVCEPDVGDAGTGLERQLIGETATAASKGQVDPWP